jgi:hypothetical protein
VIQGDATLQKEIKVLGIGVGNTPKQLEAFKTKFRTQFPLFPDQKGDIHSALGAPPTPAMIVATPAGKVLTTQGSDQRLRCFFAGDQRPSQKTIGCFERPEERTAKGKPLREESL